MLKDNLYKIALLEGESGKYKAEVVLDPAHAIFQGHFPGQPVLPGVCLLEMVKELLFEIQNRPYKLVNASTIKYLRMVDPRVDSSLTFEIALTEAGEETKVNVTTLLHDGSSNFKFKGTFA